MKRLTILRPEPGASASLAIAKALGIDAVAMPLFRIEPLAWEVPDATSFDALLLTSANAVRFAGDGLIKLRGLKVYAVGEATAQEARKAGLDIASTGSAGVERLFGSIEAGQKLLHLCGQDRMEASDKRREIKAVPVYRATELAPLEGIDRVEVAVFHSPRAARRFAELVSDRSTISIAVISQAAAEAAGTGWNEVAIAEQPEDRSLLALAKELCDKPAQQ